MRHDSINKRGRAARYRRWPAASVSAVLAVAALGVENVGPASAAGRNEVSPQAASSSCKPGATPITFWAWAYLPSIITAFNNTHPGICVVMDDAGASAIEYTKIQDALKAGAGAPDVTEIEYFVLPSFEVTHSLLNLVPYGANSMKSNYVPVAWGQVSQGSGVYAVPVDIGPLGFVYNAALFSKYKISVPTTWAQFATDSASLEKADPGAYLTSLDWTDPQFMLALMEQAGSVPISLHRWR